MRILCVDDDPTFLTLYDVTLRRQCLPGDDFMLAVSGEQARKILLDHRIDLLITDLMLPGISGQQLLEYCRSISPATEVIVVTGQGSIEAAVAAIREGARDFLTKPLNATLIHEKIATVRELIERSNQAEEYRFAKEAIEESAHRAIQDLESRLERARELIEAIGTSLGQADEADAVCDRIRGLVTRYREA